MTPDHEGHAAGHPPEHPAPTGGRPERKAAALEHHHAADFRRRFWVCLILGIPVLAYAPEIQGWFRFEAPAFPGSEWIPLLFGTAIYAYGGSVFLEGAWTELSRLRPGMMTLVALAVTVAFLYSVATEAFPIGHPLYWELATLVTVMLLGHWIEMRAVGRASGALRELAKLLPDTAERVRGDRVEEVAVPDLAPGDVMLVRPGGRIPADGVVVEGRSEVNEAMVTGESRPVSKREGDEVIAGTVNAAGALRVRVEKTGEATALAGIMRLVADAQASRSRAQGLADRAAFVLVFVALTAGGLTLVAWLLFGAGPEFALTRSVAVLVIACPHALGLAIPLVIAISTTLSARNGLLVRERTALEEARRLDVVVFDKTGTLTKGEYGVVGLATDGMADAEALRLAAAAEAPAEHPVSAALTGEARSRGVSLPPAAAFEALPGRGVRAAVEDREVMVGGAGLLAEVGGELPDPLVRATERWGAEGKSAVYLFVDRAPRAVFAFADVVREESREAIHALHEMGVKVAMLTGDSEDVARAVARDLRIEEYFAEVSPDEKVDKIHELKKRNLRVAMVGDGINDAPALLTADVGIAIGAGTNVAVESAGIILVRNDPRDVPHVLTLSRASYRKMVQNLGWATGYNVFAIPIAAGVLAPWGVVLPPAFAAILMSASTVVVAVNAQLLRRLRLGEARSTGIAAAKRRKPRSRAARG